MKYASMVVIQR